MEKELRGQPHAQKQEALPSDGHGTEETGKKIAMSVMAIILSECKIIIFVHHCLSPLGILLPMIIGKRETG